MNWYSIAQGDAPLMSGEEADALMDEALERLIAVYQRYLGRKPYLEELQYAFERQVERLAGTLGLSRKGAEMVPHGPAAGGVEGVHGRESMFHLKRIDNLQEARRMAEAILDGAQSYRIPSCEMTVRNSDGLISLIEEQLLSDGTKVVGRSYTFDTRAEALDSLSKILWESSREWNDGGVGPI